MVKKKVKKRKLKKSIYILILIILLIAFSITSYHFITLFIDYQKSKNLASDIEEQILTILLFKQQIIVII